MITHLHEGYFVFLAVSKKSYFKKKFQPLHSQDLVFSTSPYCSPYNLYDARLENSVFDQLIKVTFTCVCILNYLYQ